MPGRASGDKFAEDLKKEKSVSPLLHWRSTKTQAMRSRKANPHWPLNPEYLESTMFQEGHGYTDPALLRVTSSMRVLRSKQCEEQLEKTYGSI